MNYFEYFKNSVGNRDSIFEYILKQFNKKPISILEIGCTRNLDSGARMGDGWSSLHFYDYVSKYGGFFSTVDLDQSAIENCRTLLSSHNNFPRQVSLTINYGHELINQKYDLIYLDGGNDPQEMLEEYEKIQKISPGAVILCDDFNVKGTLLRDKYPSFELIKWRGNPHEMAIYKNSPKPEFSISYFDAIQ